MHWLAALDSAAERFDGGRRSFPLASEADFVRNYAYEPPNKDYEKLFFCRATISRSQRDPGARPHSAGWLIPTRDDASVCKPVFIAHSVLSAIWLLRETLADDVLPDNIWDRLVCAAESLAEDGMEEPPSAQKPFASPSQQASAPPPQQKKRPHLSAPAPTPKRARTTTDETHPASPQLSQPSEPDEQLKDSPLHITTISNNNRRAEQKRSRTLATSRAKKRLALGLVAPGDKAPLPEQAAYTSIVQKDESVVAWIIKQPVSDDTDFYSSTQTPYLTACTLLEKARVLGNQSSRYHAAQFLQAWRERGSPFRGGGELAGSQSRTGAGAKRLQLLSVRNDADRDFCFAWNMCTRYEAELAAVHIESRWASALLGQAYSNKIAQIRHNDFVSSNDRTRNRYGKGQIRTEAVAALVELVSPNATEKDKQVFRRRLGQAMRWYSISQELGWGILTLIPHDEIANRWIERTLRIKLLKKECPDICAASKALKNWLGPEGIAGGPINEKKTLSIEAEAPATIYEVEEIQDSEDDETDNSVDDSTREQSHASPKSPTPAPRLRQLTLLELFHPVE
ncbi:uncharacterized protein EKO05_0011214 [Ascochyta rabiei]|uniref:uncharacterized protein n=1 Tax=Didymella rabiei TaxID=5454 RepID=UPI002206BCBA|nr:uncharacterized protein EKO05_0011214 [Ascochyta rabiei]UPX21008.1 hypothetical protein EKO05_0011214 [Ascochyta rabiei]